MLPRLYTAAMSLHIARQFGEALVAEDYDAARSLLTKEARRVNSADGLREDVERMIAHAEEPLQIAEVVEDGVLYDWPDKKPGDLAHVYVALSGESFTEAVIVILTTTDEGVRIRDLEWGRP
jgi:hypothetical protein